MKSSHAEREEKILEFWKKEQIFEKSLEKNKAGGREFVFYEGPPTANGHPGIHHLEARAFKDAIPRYKTMQGFYVRRKGGWDTHGLPVELQVEKELGLKSKKEIEAYGVEAFNEKCKDSVWTYVREWEDFTKRMGYWVDLNDPYITYKPQYIESLWNILKTVHEKHLLYKDYKVVPWCPRCGTALSSHELAQGYETVKDLSVTVEFRLKSKPPASFLAWTTTPWTLPGNVALAINPNIRYAEVEVKQPAGVKRLILAKDRVEKVFAGQTYEVVGEVRGQDLVGLEYEPLYPFLKTHLPASEKEKLANAYKIYPAEFVTTDEGTGIVHTAVMYGQDDFELGTKVGLPKYHLVNEDGTFKIDAGFLGMRFVKDEETNVEIIKDLAHRGLLFHKEKHEHTYPFCWRCKTPLIYFARDSWYIRMSDLRDELVNENKNIHWEPEHIKEGRFGEWLREIKDWAISRERYWGTPLPVWICDHCNQLKVVGRTEEVMSEPKNTYYGMRHGEAESNVQGILSGVPDAPHHLTEKGKNQVAEAAKKIKKIKFDHIYVSPFVRTRETLEILRKTTSWKDDQIHVDDRIRELGSGSWNGRSVKEYQEYFSTVDRFAAHPDGVENYAEIKRRMGEFLYDLEKKHAGATILIITHETPEFLLEAAARGLDRKQSMKDRGDKEFIKNAELRKIDFRIMPHNAEYELDLHRPYIDEVKIPCGCGKGEMKRVKEVMDVWFDSGSMPFAQDHYPFERKKEIFGLIQGHQKLAYPADFICEAIDQTRGWFYTLHAVGVLMGKGRAFNNVVCLGHILDTQGKKMSKSLGNILNPFELMDKYGADALRFWMYSVNQPGESKNFDERTIDEVIKKVFNLAQNVTTFYKMYEKEGIEPASSSPHVLDQWILSRLNELTEAVTKSLENYVFLDATRSIRDFIADLSQWYLRRSRERFKEEGSDKDQALAVTKHVLLTLAKIMAPFTPYFAEYLYVEVDGQEESVHLDAWPSGGTINKNLLADMQLVREYSSKGLEARSAAKINVRQPLQTMRIKDEKIQSLTDNLKALIRDEVNVKEVVYYMTIEKEVELDTMITLELKEEGEIRELIRKVQDLRKEKGLSIKDKATLVVTADQKDLVGRNEAKIKEATMLDAIEFGDTFSVRT